MPPVMEQSSTSFPSCDAIAALKARCVETNSVTAAATGKKTVWALSEWENPGLGPRPPIQWLDEPGVAENGDLLR